jgi:glyoxylase-like metal-dependent hydrolase (beta-lactamase superfamily II)
LVEHEDTVVWCHESLTQIIEHPERFSVMCLYPKGVPVGRSFRDGEAHQWREYTIRTWHYPGQTEYHCLILIEIDGKNVLFTGDSVFKEGAEWTSPIIFRNAFRPDSHRRCVEVLRQLPEIDLICPGHGPPVAPDEDWIDSFEARTERLLGQFEELLGPDRLGPGVDPFRVRIVPYTIAAEAAKTFRAEVEVRSYAAETQEAVVRLSLPEDWMCLPLMQTMEVPAGDAVRTFFRVTPPEVIKPVRRRIITADVTLGDVPLGQAAEAVVEFDGPRLMLR